MDGSSANPERILALTYAPTAAREALAALFGLDDALAALLRSTTEPAIAQIRLAWWRENLAGLGSGAIPAAPVLRSVFDHVVSCGIAGDRLVAIVEGWETLIEAERLDQEALVQFAAKRGGTLFAIAAELLGTSGEPRTGEGWALADLARHLDDPAEAEAARAMARDRLAAWGRWPGRARVLGALALIARMDLEVPFGVQPPVGSPRRVARLAWMRMTGR